MTKAREILLQNLAAGEYVDQFEKYEWQNNHEQYQKHLIKEY
jgi:type IV secretory pathway component VirB8